jgi:hypothetical protein
MDSTKPPAQVKSLLWPQGFDHHVVELMLEALRVETAAQEDYATASPAESKN